MLLGAAWAMDPLRRPAPRWLGWLGWASLWGTATGLAVAAAILPWVADGVVMPVSLLALPVAVLAAWGVTRLARGGQWARAGLAAAILSVPLYAVVLGGVLPGLRAPWVSPRIAALLAAEGTPPQRFGIAGYHEPSVVFAAGTATRLLTGGADAARFLAEAPGRVAAVEARELPRFEVEAASLGLRTAAIGRVEGFNLVRGRRVSVVLLRPLT